MSLQCYSLAVGEICVRFMYTSFPQRYLGENLTDFDKVCFVLTRATSFIDGMKLRFIRVSLSTIIYEWKFQTLFFPWYSISASKILQLEYTLWSLIPTQQVSLKYSLRFYEKIHFFYEGRCDFTIPEVILRYFMHPHFTTISTDFWLIIPF